MIAKRCALGGILAECLEAPVGRLQSELGPSPISQADAPRPHTPRLLSRTICPSIGFESASLRPIGVLERTRERRRDSLGWNFNRGVI